MGSLSVESNMATTAVPCKFESIEGSPSEPTMASAKPGHCYSITSSFKRIRSRSLIHRCNSLKSALTMLTRHASKLLNLDTRTPRGKGPGEAKWVKDVLKDGQNHAWLILGCASLCCHTGNRWYTYSQTLDVLWACGSAIFTFGAFRNAHQMQFVLASAGYTKAS